MCLAHVEGMNGVNATEDEDILTPVDHLIPELQLGRVAGPVEVFGNPEVEQGDVLTQGFLGLLVERRTVSMDRRKIRRPGNPPQCRPVAALADGQFMRSLEHGRNDVALLVVQVAIIDIGVIEVGIGSRPVASAVNLFTQLSGSRHIAAGVIANDRPVR